MYHYRVRGESLINTAKQKDFQVLVNQLAAQKKLMVKDADIEFQDYFDALMFLHIGISLTFRLVQGDKKNTSVYIRETKKILDTEFSRWRKSKYLSLPCSARKGIKGIGLWGCRLLYKINLFIIFINFYLFIQSKLHKDIKW